MKRTALLRRSELKRRKPPQARLSHVDRTDPARMAWKTPMWGACTVCGKVGWLENHHVVQEQHIPEERPELRYDLRNAMRVGVETTCLCHTRHSNAFQRIPIRLISKLAWEFARELFGEATARAYFERRYAVEDRSAA